MKSIKKQLYTTALGFGLLSVLGGCNDSFMDRFPETSITEKVFFRMWETWSRTPMACMGI